jgi:hypothetical protein
MEIRKDQDVVEIKFRISLEDEEMIKALTSAKKNKLKLDCLYDEVLRPVIKYDNLKGYDGELTVAQYEVLSQLIENITEYLGEE